MGRWSNASKEHKGFGINSQAQLDKETALFRRAVAKSFDLASSGNTGRLDNPLFWNLRNAFVQGDALGLARELKYAFQTFVLRSHFPKAITDIHQQLADLRFPYEWYPATRMLQRTVHLHVGPTNSGKTYNALKALENAKSGIYAGPLRLLAHEVYLRFEAKGKPCALVTGEEVRIPENTDRYFSSCTVEMAPLNRLVDVAIIDEIQMIHSDDRGWAWTQAFLGIQARELHLCGEERTVDLIQSMCARLGEKCIVHRYNRLSPLETMQKSLKGKFENLRKGDAVVAFTRIGLHQLKAGIESSTGRRCAIVYGSLPPETRVQQAALFNDPDNDFDFLVASDAIGMGLNLEVKRVIFESASKFDGMAFRELTIPEVKQIGGRAGRYRTANQAVKQSADSAVSPTPETETAQTAPRALTAKGTSGYVTTMDEEDLPLIRRHFESEAPSITTAGIVPPTFMIERFCSYFPENAPFSFILARLRELSRMSEAFHMCDFRDRLEIAEVIEEFPMSTSDRCIFLAAPVSLRDASNRAALRAFASCVSEMRGGHLLEVRGIDLEILEIDRQRSGLTDTEYLVRLEGTHKAITLYLWLSYRFNGVFTSQSLAFHVKSLLEEKITNHLQQLTYVDANRQRRIMMARSRAEAQRQKEKQLLAAGTAIAAERVEGGSSRWEIEGDDFDENGEDAASRPSIPGAMIPDTTGSEGSERICERV
ncbi:hypothetical protein P8C59_001474 [Phyllachora maydis]|uniref:RNA helicase n=1 Tax=Phyllachora maydis TaxID=1825666 RepID=A0AAD9HZH1_9PEZI|nr:hypothetical protein P8C59_001474 [Phyllachora maydis]